ncbi:DIP1984 family protein [Clavibacter michiganensis]|uniref:DIP1984 family protein n=1 Tax=Clavibacter michiganensis TaxID=28447 RepID=UPI001BE0904A|nr:DIP1984 family protein [Clavibacter michiganensis]MBT1636395.1 DIP1984 family protein [Clavibacter michiganensis]
MRLAEALMERSDLQRRVESLRSRIQATARYQEGEDPAEDAAALLAEAVEAVDLLAALVTRINVTNTAAHLDDGTPLTAALARRDALRTRHGILTSAADAASGRTGGGMAAGYAPRQMRSELRQIAALPIREVRDRADDAARELRELDARIQRANWEVELVEEGDGTEA